MTGTSVNDVNGLMNFFIQTKEFPGKAVNEGFSEVLNSKTAEAGGNVTPDRKEALVNAKKPEAGASLKEKSMASAKTDRVKDGMEGKSGSVDKEKTLPLEETDEEAEEVLGCAAMQLVTELAELFQITPHKLQEVMEQLGMQETDVLNKDSLGSLVLALGGAQDSLALLTNADLYEKYSAVMEELTGLLEGVKETLGMNDAELSNAIEMLQNPQEVSDEKTEEIPIEITVDTAEEETEVENPEEKTGNEESVLTKESLTEESGKATEKSSENKDGREQSHENSTQNQTAFAEQLKPESMQTQAAQTAEKPFVWSTDTQDIMRQIMDYMKIQVKSDVSSLEMQLHPASLGTVQIQLVSKGGAVSAHFVTENEAVKAALESQLVQLKESFAEQGVKVEAVEVSVQTHQFERNLDQGRGRQSEEDSRKTKSGRIRMRDAVMAEDEEEELPNDEMQVNGSTVNYTA